MKKFITKGLSNRRANGTRVCVKRVNYCGNLSQANEVHSELSSAWGDLHVVTYEVQKRKNSTPVVRRVI